MNPIKVLQNALDAIKKVNDIKAAFDGIRDEISSIFTNQQITAAHSLVRGLEECEPISDHVNELSLSVMSKAIKNSNYKLAKDAITSSYLLVLQLLHVVSIQIYSLLHSLKLLQNVICGSLKTDNL